MFVFAYFPTCVLNRFPVKSFFEVDIYFDSCSSIELTI